MTNTDQSVSRTQGESQKRKPLWKDELYMLFKLAGPTIVQTASQQAMVFTDQIFLGHLGTEEMAGAALGNMYAAFLSFFLFGTATALDTLGSQAYGAQKRGAKPAATLVTWTFVAFVSLTALCVPASIGLAVAGPMAEYLLSQPPQISHLTAEFCAGLIPGLWPLMWSQALMKYLQVQNVVLGPAIITAATFCLNIGANFVFIDGMGYKGAPLATSFSRLVQFIAMCFLVYFFEHTKGTKRNRFAAFLFQGADDDADVSVHHHHASQHADLKSQHEPDGHRRTPHAVYAVLPSAAHRTSLDAETAVELVARTVQGHRLHTLAETHAHQHQQDQQHPQQAHPDRTGDLADRQHDTVVTPRYPEGGLAEQEASSNSSADKVHVENGHDDHHVLKDQEGQPLLPHQDGKSCLPLSHQHAKPVAVGSQTGGEATKTTPITSSARMDVSKDASYSVAECHQGAPKQHMTFQELAQFILQQSKAAVSPALLWEYMKLALPGGIMTSCEQGSFDVTTAFASQLGPVPTAAHSAMLNIVGLTFMSCPLAVGIAGSIRVGNLLGEMRAQLAKLSAWLCVAIGGGFMACCAAVIIGAKDHVGKIFSNDMEIVAMMATIAPFCGIFQVCDGLMGTAQGALRGCGKQRILMVYNLVGFWLCGVLLGYLLCFHANMGLVGLWIGIAVGDTATCILNVTTLWFVNWRKEADNAAKRIADEDAGTGDGSKHAPCQGAAGGDSESLIRSGIQRSDDVEAPAARK